MKKVVLSLVFVLGSLFYVGAQEKTILDVSQAQVVNLVVDFSNASIHNMDENAFSTYEPSYAKGKNEVIAKLVEEFNDEEKVGFILGNFPKADYTVKVNVVAGSRKGDMLSNAEILDIDGNVIATISDIKGDGGTFGSNMNLMGDGCKSTGEALAKRMAKMIKVEKKKAKQ